MHVYYFSTEFGSCRPGPRAIWFMTTVCEAVCFARSSVGQVGRTSGNELLSIVNSFRRLHGQKTRCGYRYPGYRKRRGLRVSPTGRVFGYFDYPSVGNGRPLSCLRETRSVRFLRTYSCLTHGFGMLLSPGPRGGPSGPAGVGGQDGRTGKRDISAFYTHVLTSDNLACRSIATRVFGGKSARDVFRTGAFHPKAISRCNGVISKSSIVVRCCSLSNVPIACAHGLPKHNGRRLGICCHIH